MHSTKYQNVYLWSFSALTPGCLNENKKSETEEKKKNYILHQNEEQNPSQITFNKTVENLQCRICRSFLVTFGKVLVDEALFCFV